MEITGGFDGWLFFYFSSLIAFVGESAADGSWSSWAPRVVEILERLPNIS